MRIQTFLVWITLILLPSAAAWGQSANGVDLFPGAMPPQRIVAITTDALADPNGDEELSEARRLLVASLQGLAVDSPIGIYLMQTETHGHWLQQIAATEGVPITYALSLEALLDEVGDDLLITGYIRTTLRTEAVNAATSLAALHRAPVVDKRLVPWAEAQGWTERIDATGLREHDAWEIGAGAYAAHVLFQQDPQKSWHLRDAVIGSGGFVFYDPPDDFYDEIAAHALPNAPLLGWGAGGEDRHVGRATVRGLRTIPADWALNLSVLARFQRDRLVQRREWPEALDYEESVHYVTFVMSDGDNIQWVMNNFARNAHYFGSPVRGDFPMGWQMAPGLIDAAPHVLEWLYAAEAHDEFVMGVSSTGYFYPSRYPDDAFQQLVMHLPTMIERSDMRIVTILDTAPLDSEAFTRVAWIFSFVEHLQGGIYLNYADYAGGRGEVVWAGEMPFISARFKLWDADPVALAAEINRQARTPESAAGYSVVSVHPWSHSLADVANVVEHLDDHVRVVLPSELVARVRTFVQRP